MSNDIKSAGHPAARGTAATATGPGFLAARDLPAGGFGVLTIMLGLFGESARQLLRYERAEILQEHEFWRLLSGHFVHLGWPHLLLNLAGCLLVWLLFRRDYRLSQWALLIMGTALGISLGFLWLNPTLDWYVGLSGLLHGLFAAGLLSWLREGGIDSWLVFLVFAAKLGWEQWVGPLPLTSESAGGPVIVDAHFYGALSGAALAALLLFAGRRTARV